MTATDAELIARVRAAGDRPAFSELVLRHQSAVRRFLRHLTHGDAALADDLAQETFLTAWRGLARFQGTASFSTWLLGIAHNRWRNARRRRHDCVSLEAEEYASNFSVPAATPRSDLHQDLAEALTTLSPDEQLTLHLGFQQGLSHSEIAALLDWPLGTVKTHLARGKEKLRSLLTAWNPQT